MLRYLRIREANTRVNVCMRAYMVVLQVWAGVCLSQVEMN